MWQSHHAAKHFCAGLVAASAALNGRHSSTKGLLTRCKEQDTRIEVFKKLQHTNLRANSRSTKDQAFPEANPSALIGIYFSAHWCGPCRHFTPKFAQCYRELKQAGKPFEVIFVSCDNKEEEFTSYHAEMPWSAVPFSEIELRKSLQADFAVQGIPKLVLLKSDGTLVTDEGVTAIHYGKEFFPWGPEEMRRAQSELEKAGEEVQLLALCAERDSLVLQQIRGGPVQMRMRGSPGMSCMHHVAKFSIDFHEFATVAAPGMLATSGILYYEVELLSSDGIPQFGFACAGFEKTDEPSDAGVGDDEISWSVDGQRELLWHRGEPIPWNSTWSAGDVIGLAANVDAGKIAVTKNGICLGVVFESEGIKAGIFPAYSCIGYKLRYNLDGDTHGPFRHAPPPSEIWARAALV